MLTFEEKLDEVFRQIDINLLVEECSDEIDLIMEGVAPSDNLPDFVIENLTKIKKAVSILILQAKAKNMKIVKSDRLCMVKTAVLQTLKIPLSRVPDKIDLELVRILTPLYDSIYSEAELIARTPRLPFESKSV